MLKAKSGHFRSEQVRSGHFGSAHVWSGQVEHSSRTRSCQVSALSGGNGNCGTGKHLKPNEAASCFILHTAANVLRFCNVVLFYFHRETDSVYDLVRLRLHLFYVLAPLQDGDFYFQENTRA